MNTLLDEKLEYEAKMNAFFAKELAKQGINYDVYEEERKKAEKKEELAEYLEGHKVQALQKLEAADQAIVELYDWLDSYNSNIDGNDAHELADPKFLLAVAKKLHHMQKYVEWCFQEADTIRYWIDGETVYHGDPVK